MSYQWQREQLLGIMKSCISSEVLLPLSITNLTLTLFLATFYTNVFNIKGLSFVFFFINQYIAVFNSFKIRRQSLLQDQKQFFSSFTARKCAFASFVRPVERVGVLTAASKCIWWEIGPNMDLFLELFASCLVLWG